MALSEAPNADRAHAEGRPEEELSTPRGIVADEFAEETMPSATSLALLAAILASRSCSYALGPVALWGSPPPPSWLSGGM